MSSRRGLRRLVDPWAALLLGVLVALGVVILLATPGPWHRVVGPARVQLLKPPPRDVALYVRAAAPTGRCTTVAWLHMEYTVPSLTVVLVPPETQVPVARGGLAPVGRLVSDVGPAAATAGLAEALQTPLGGWVVIDRQTLRLVLAAAKAPRPDRFGVPAFREAMTALRATPLTLPALTAQQRVLAGLLPGIPYALLNQTAIVNFVLGSAAAESDLDLRAASAFVRTLRGLTPADIAVRTLPVIVEHCGAATAWRVDRARAERVRLSLSFGLKPPPSPPLLLARRRTPEVIVVTAPGRHADAFAATLRRVLRGEAAGPVSVTLRGLPSTEAESVRLQDEVDRRRPLALVVAPWLAAEPAGSTAPSPSTPTGDPLASLLTSLAGAWQPAIVVAPAAVVVPAPQGSLATAPVVVSSTQTASGTETSFAPETQARLAAETLVRSCWPDYLAPDSAGTQVGFTYAARQAITLAVLSGDSPGDLALARQLAAAGYTLRPLGLDAWRAPAGGSLIGYGPGMGRAALVLQGDVSGLLQPLSHRRGSLPLFAVKDGPEPLTLVVAQ